MKTPFLKSLQVIFFLLYTVLTFGQIPAGYYDPAQGLTGDNLKAALHNIIKGHKEYPYTSTGTDVWDILKLSDQDPGNPANVILFYTGWSVNAAQEYNNGKGWNREHVWAKSRGDFGTTEGPGTDCHHLRPVDIIVNDARNNRWFDNCTIPFEKGTTFTGCFYSTTEWTWEPRDAVKGDVARILFYMATRYEGDNGEPDLEVIDYFPDDDNTKLPVQAKLSTLLEWNTEDPVDSFERHRNEVVYSFQHNRNPYIDHPEYVNLVFGKMTPNQVPNITDISISPENPLSSEPVYISASVVDPDGSLTNVSLDWGPSEIDLSNEAGMIYNGSRYVTSITAEDGETEIFYRISATDNSGDSENSTILHFDVGSSSSSSTTPTGSLRVYPNPASDKIFISGQSEYSISIYSLSGQVMKTETGKTVIDLRTLPAGFYLIKVKDLHSGEVISKPLIISR